MTILERFCGAKRVTDALILYNYNTFVQDHALSVVLQSALV